MGGPDEATVRTSLVPTHRIVVAGSAGLLACLLWSYWPTVTVLAAFWAENDDYSVGALVPIVAAYLIWRNRQHLDLSAAKPCLWGFPALIGVQAIRLVGLYFDYASVERYSLVLTIAAMVLLLAGHRTLRRGQWILLFLFLMVPPPGRVHLFISLPLQSQATAMAAFALEVLGFFVVRDGHILNIDNLATVAVAEACSGLRMLTAFVFVAAVLAFVARRPSWQKAVLVTSSVPIAIFVNAIRLVVTAAYVVRAGSADSVVLFHDYAGFVMMPVAVLLLFLEVRLLSALTSEQKPAVGRGAAPVVR